MSDHARAQNRQTHGRGACRKLTPVLIAVVAVFTALALWGEDPWKQKSYKEWDENDVRRILNNSPWSKPVASERKKKKLDLEAPAGAPTASGARKEDEEEDEAEEHRGGNEEREEEERERGAAAHPEFIVRWISSRTLREASVRGQVLKNQIPASEMDQQLPLPAEDYQLAVVGINMSFFQNLDEATLRQGTYLKGKNSREKIEASQVEVVRSLDGKRINAVIFHFPKTSAAGQAVVSPTEKEIRFVTQTASVEIEANFEPQKMVDRQGTDLKFRVMEPTRNGTNGTGVAACPSRESTLEALRTARMAWFTHRLRCRLPLQLLGVAEKGGGVARAILQ